MERNKKYTFFTYKGKTQNLELLACDMRFNSKDHLMGSFAPKKRFCRTILVYAEDENGDLKFCDSCNHMSYQRIPAEITAEELYNYKFNI